MNFKNYLFLVFCFFKLECAATSSDEAPMTLQELEYTRVFLFKKLPPAAQQEVDDICSECVRVFEGIKNSVALQDLHDSLGWLGIRLSNIMENDPTFNDLIARFKKPVRNGNDLFELLKATLIKSNPNASGIRIGHQNSTGDVDLTLSYARDTINEIIPDYVYRFLKSNEGDWDLKMKLDIQIDFARNKLASAQKSKKKARMGKVEMAVKGTVASDVVCESLAFSASVSASSESLVCERPVCSSASIVGGGEEKTVAEETDNAYSLSALKSIEGAETPETMISDSEEMTVTITLSPYHEQLRALQKTSFFSNWLNKSDVASISAIFNTAGELVASRDVAGLLERLVKKQKDQGMKAQYRQKGSHALAVLTSSSGKKIIFPFANHSGSDLDRNSRDLVKSGFEKLFCLSRS
jgi:hypothetical protein